MLTTGVLLKQLVYTVLVTRKKPVKDSDSQVLHISIGSLIYCKIRKTRATLFKRS